MRPTLKDMLAQQQATPRARDPRLTVEPSQTHKGSDNLDYAHVQPSSLADEPRTFF